MWYHFSRSDSLLVPITFNQTYASREIHKLSYSIYFNKWTKQRMSNVKHNDTGPISTLSRIPQIMDSTICSTVRFCSTSAFCFLSKQNNTIVRLLNASFPLTLALLLHQGVKSIVIKANKYTSKMSWFVFSQQQVPKMIQKWQRAKVHNKQGKYRWKWEIGLFFSISIEHTMQLLTW